MARRKSKIRKVKKLLTPRQRWLRMKKTWAKRRKGKTSQDVVVSEALSAKELLAPRDKVLMEAREAISVSREDTHGAARHNFETIANLKEVFWRAFDYAHGDDPDAVLRNRNSAQGHAIDMICMKLGRIACGEASVDHFVDIAGYSALGVEVAE